MLIGMQYRVNVGSFCGLNLRFLSTVRSLLGCLKEDGWMRRGFDNIIANVDFKPDQPRKLLKES